MCGVSVRYDEGQGDTLPSSLPRGLPATMPEDQRQMSYVQARAQVRLNKRHRELYPFDYLQKDLRDSQNAPLKKMKRRETYIDDISRMEDLQRLLYIWIYDFIGIERIYGVNPFHL